MPSQGLDGQEPHTQLPQQTVFSLTPETPMNPARGGENNRGLTYSSCWNLGHLLQEVQTFASCWWGPAAGQHMFPVPEGEQACFPGLAFPWTTDSEPEEGASFLYHQEISLAQGRWNLPRTVFSVQKMIINRTADDCFHTPRCVCVCVRVCSVGVDTDTLTYPSFVNSVKVHTVFS